MAKIETRKSLILEPKPATMQLSVGPGVVTLAIENDAVTHLAAMDPNEATQMGVALIQLAAQAHALHQQQQVQLAQAMPGLQMNGSAKPFG